MYPLTPLGQQMLQDKCALNLLDRFWFWPITFWSIIDLCIKVYLCILCVLLDQSQGVFHLINSWDVEIWKMLNKRVIVPGNTTVQQKNEHEEMCEIIHASTLTRIFFRSSHQKAVHTWNSLQSVLTVPTLLTPRANESEPTRSQKNVIPAWDERPIQV